MRHLMQAFCKLPLKDLVSNDDLLCWERHRDLQALMTSKLWCIFMAWGNVEALYQKVPVSWQRSINTFLICCLKLLAYVTPSIQSYTNHTRKCIRSRSIKLEVGYYLHREGPNLGKTSCPLPPITISLRRTVRDPLPEVRRFWHRHCSWAWSV